MISPSPYPTFIPQNAVEVQQLQLLHQIQNQQMPFWDTIILGVLLKFPLPESIFSMQSRLDMFYAVTASNSPVMGITNTHPATVGILFLFWPLLLIFGVIILYYSIKVLRLLLQEILPIVPILLGRFVTESPKVFLEIKPPAAANQSAFSTERLFTFISSQGRQQSYWRKFFHFKKRMCLEIVSTKEDGIRYVIQTTEQEASIFERTLLSYMPGIAIQRIADYLPSTLNEVKGSNASITEFKLANHFSYPLQDQKKLGHHDPIAYITGQMTKLSNSDMIAMQLILTPVTPNNHGKIFNTIEELTSRIWNKLEIADITIKRSFLNRTFNILFKIIGITVYVSLWQIFVPLGLVLYFTGKAPSPFIFPLFRKKASTIIKSSQQEELYNKIQRKIDEQLCECSLRLFVAVESKEASRERVEGFTSSLASFTDPALQGIIKNVSFLQRLANLFNRRLYKRFLFFKFKNRLLSLSSSGNLILSSSEVADIYHLPYSQTTKTEDLAKVQSIELPAPLSFKRTRGVDIIFGRNFYGGETTDIGLTEEERQTHMYILGRTGSGKTTLMFSMTKHDIEQGRGLAFIDPHGDVAEDLVASIPLERKDDLIYVNPIDLKFPIGINLLELTPGLDEDAAELEKEVVAEGVISLFRKVFSQGEQSNAHRIEYILRNTIYTAFTVEGCTLFTINKILTNPTFRKQVISGLKDEDLIDFWKYEFGKAGDFQVVKMTQGVTAKVGRFMRSPTAKRILEQPKSTINFDDVINQGKILICNFSQGKLGEDSSRLMGTTIMTKLQQAALKRAYIPQDKRTSFYLYVDEFQTFATQSFSKMVTEGRKYKMPLIIAEQSTSQQKDKDITNIILANVTTVVSFRSGNHIDEELMLNQFRPHLEKGAIMNLPRYRFYIKISAIDSEEPFSGETIFIPVEKDQQKIDKLIEASRKNWAIPYVKPPVENEKKSTEITTRQIPTIAKKIQSKSGFPELRKG